MKEQQIRNYISSIDFKNENFSVKEMQLNLKRLLNESPGITVNYKKDVMVNEIKGESVEIKKPESVSITFLDMDDNYKTLEFLL